MKISANLRKFHNSILLPRGTIVTVPENAEAFAGWDRGYIPIPAGQYRLVETGSPHLCEVWEQVKEV